MAIDYLDTLERRFEQFLLAFAAIFIPAALFLSLNHWLTQTLAVVLALIAAVGFVRWILPSFQKLAALSRKAKVHALVLLLATIPARWVVSDATGLPPDDLDYAVVAATMGFYVAIVVYGAAALMLLILLGLLARVLFQHTISLFDADSKTKEAASKLWFRFFGAAALVVILAWLGGSYGGLLRKLEPSLLWISYWTDYVELPGYPGVNDGERVCLHKNGLISIATMTDHGVVIEKRNI